MRRIAIGLVFLVGCFKEPDAPVSGGTSGDECTPGTVLCACLPDNTCNMGLECIPEGCIPADCDPGNPTCECLVPGDMCTTGWVCIDGLCREDPGETTMPAMTTASGPDTMSTTPETSETTPGSTDGGTGPMTSSSASESVTMSTGGPACGVLDCFECLQCSFEEDCKPEYDTCEADGPGCGVTLSCLQTCLAMTPDSLETCELQCGCDMAPPDLAVTLADCATTVCGDACEQPIPCAQTD